MAVIDVSAGISFLYFDDMEKACDFFGEILGFPLACDQGWSKIYEVTTGFFIGAVNRSRGACKATSRDGVLTSFVVRDFDRMVERLQEAGIVFEKPPHFSEQLEIKSLMFWGPEGYLFEMEEFMNEEIRSTIYRSLPR